MKFLKLSALAIVGACVVGEANAASWLECDGDKIVWDGNSTTARINATSFPAGAFRDAVQRGIAITNRNPSPFVINTTIETGGVARGNGQNEIFFSNISAPGEARMRYHCYWFFGTRSGLDEVDIVLDNRNNYWTTSTSKNANIEYGGNGRPIEAVIVHEAGHFLGLMHVDTEYNIMGDAWRHHHTNGATARSYFGEDGGAGARALYGAQGGAFNDVSVSHWRYTGSDGEYSTHDRTRLFTSGGSAMTPSTVSGEPRYNVVRGRRYRAEFTVENNGKSTVSNIGYGIYISTNDTISTFDTRVGGGSYSSIHPGNVATHQFSFTVPTTLSANRNYWVGVVIDENNTLSEVSGSNNATYIGLRTN